MNPLLEESETCLNLCVFQKNWEHFYLRKNKHINSIKSWVPQQLLSRVFYFLDVLMFSTLLSHCLSISDYKLNWIIYQYDPLLSSLSYLTMRSWYNKLQSWILFQFLKESRYFKWHLRKKAQTQSNKQINLSTDNLMLTGRYLLRYLHTELSNWKIVSFKSHLLHLETQL